MKVAVVRPQDLGAEELARWRKWQGDDDRLASPFLAPEFAVAFGNHYERARVAVIEDGTGLLGCLPFELHRVQVGRSFAFDLSDSQALLCGEDFEWNPVELLQACGLSVWEFDHLVAHQAPLFRPHHFLIEPAPVIDLTAGFDEWMKAKRRSSQSRMKKVVQKQRKLEREVGTLDFDLNSQSIADLSQLMIWKAAQYVRTGRSDRFSDPAFRGFVEELFAVRTDDFEMHLSRLDSGDTTAALYLSLRANNRLAGWFPAHNAEIAAYSPGMACMLALIEAAAGQGLTRLDLGEGAADYKESFKNFDDHVAEGWVERRTPAAVFRRAQLAPKRAAFKVVLGNPRLRKAARSTLIQVGRVRSRLSSRTP